jgi:periplasmic divalent cation tolerance protein
VFIAWTTVANRADADRLADEAITRSLAVCVQIDGPITSVYRWEGKVERSEEFRLAFKCVPDRLYALKKLVLDHHPYDIPEWIAVRADQVAEKYLSWAGANSSNPPL